MADIALLLDEHYPATLTRHLAAVGIDVDSVVTREDLRGQPDAKVLAAAAHEGRAVVTEDVTTFPAAIIAVPRHAGVIYCDAQRFPRTVHALPRLEAALAAFVHNPPQAAQYLSFVWWLASVPSW